MMAIFNILDELKTFDMFGKHYNLSTMSDKFSAMSDPGQMMQ